MFLLILGFPKCKQLCIVFKSGDINNFVQILTNLEMPVLEIMRSMTMFKSSLNYNVWWYTLYIYLMH